MAYENTHLFAADKVRKCITNTELAGIISSNLNQYYLGSVFPDTMSYSKNKKIREVAGYLHGNSGVPTNNFVFEMLDQIKNIKNYKNLAFILGFLTHCAIDIVIHPPIFYYSGFKWNGSKRENKRASYLHWHLETYLDKIVNSSHYLEKMIKLDYLDGLIIDKLLDIPFSVIKNALKKQISYFKITHSRFNYRIYLLLNCLRIMPKNKIGGFYENLNKEKVVLPNKLIYRDIISGKLIETTLSELMKNAIELGKKMIEASYEFYCGKIDRKTCEKIVIGNNLNTGHFGKLKKDIRFSQEI